MDPLADKLLVCSALICFVGLGRLNAVVVIVIVAREFIISGFRLVAAEQGKVIAASWWGKWKTAVTMIAIIIQLLALNPMGFPGGYSDTDPASVSGIYSGVCVFALVLFYIATALTVISLIDYIAKNKEVLSDV